MNIFRLFKSKKNIKICSKTHQIAPFKKIFLGSMPPNSPSKRLATPYIARRFAECTRLAPKLGPPGKSCIRPWTTTKKCI